LGDEDEALETPQPEQSSLEGQIKEATETPQKEWCDSGEKEVMIYEWVPSPEA